MLSPSKPNTQSDNNILIELKCYTKRGADKVGDISNRTIRITAKATAAATATATATA